MSAERRPAGPLAALTGGTGFLGSHIADRLLERGWRVRVSVRDTSDLRWLRGKPVEEMRVSLMGEPAAAGGTARGRAGRGEAGRAGRGPGGGGGALAPAADLPTFLRGATAVVHCAGIVRARDERTYMEVNAETTGRLLEAATEAGCRTFVLVSSLAAGGPAPPERPRVDGDPDAPLTAYGRSKLAAEKLLQRPELQLRTAALRPPALYGPRDRSFLPMFRLARLGLFLRAGGPLRALSLVDGRDAAAAAVALLETEHAHGVYHLDDGHAYAWAELRETLAAITGRRLRTVTVPLGALDLLAVLAGERLRGRVPILERDRRADLAVPGWVCDGSRLRRDCGFAPRWDLRSGWADTLDFYRRSGWLDAKDDRHPAP